MRDANCTAHGSSKSMEVSGNRGPKKDTNMLGFKGSQSRPLIFLKPMKLPEARPMRDHRRFLNREATRSGLRNSPRWFHRLGAPLKEVIGLL